MHRDLRKKTPCGVSCIRLTFWGADSSSLRGLLELLYIVEGVRVRKGNCITADIEDADAKSQQIQKTVAIPMATAILIAPSLFCM